VSAEVQSAVELLRKKPTDPQANLKVGNFRCQVKGDWPGGLPLLALCSDDALKTLAVEELAGPTSPEKLVALGDGWWEQAERLTGPTKAATQAHAAQWYQKALASMDQGLLRTKLELRIQAATELCKSGSATAATPKASAAATNVNPFLGIWEKSTMRGGLRFTIEPAGKAIAADGKIGSWSIRSQTLLIAWPDQNQMYDLPVGDTMTGKTVPSSPQGKSTPIRARRITNAGEHH
jgi:hypothetical protein